MLAVTTSGGTSLINPTKFKHPSSTFPISLECSTSSWSSSNSLLYLTTSSSIKRYSPLECLLEEIYCGANTVTCLAFNDKSNTLFFASANRVWSLDCAKSPGRLLSCLEPHESAVTMISLSNDGNLLVSVSASAVFVHNLTLSSYVQLKGLPDDKPVLCSLFHQHSRTRILLGIGRDIFVYESTRHFGPLKMVRVPGVGEVVGIAASPFSKTLVTAVTSNGDVALVDIDKDNGILKTASVKASLTCCAFTAEGAAIYLGTKSGKLLILDLRSLEKEPKSFTIGDNRASIVAIDVQEKSKTHVSDTFDAKVKSSSSATARFSPQHPAPSTRMASACGIVGPEIKPPAPVSVASKIRGGGGATPKKKLFSPVRTPLSATKNSGLDARLGASRSPNISRQMKPVRLRRSKEQEENGETDAQQPLPSISRTELTTTRRQVKPGSHHEVEQDVKHLGLGSAPESISGHLAAMRVRSGPPSNSGLRDEDNRLKTTTRRIVSESVESAPLGRKLRTISISSTQSRVLSLKPASDILRMQKKQERRSTTPDNENDRANLSSPDLPREPVTPISLGKSANKAPLASATTTSGVLGLTSPEVIRWARGEEEKGKERKDRVIEKKKTRFVQYGDATVPFEVGGELADEVNLAEGQDEKRQELSLQVSPQRPTAPPAWLQSPHRPSSANLNMNAAAQDFLRGIIHDVMYDFQRETKADMMDLHLDVVRMGRGWKQDLREIMGENRELKAENRRLKEENERLRRGY